REKFLLYLNDGDFSSHDQGLAGVVLTDQRLIFHKHHHSGQAVLDQAARLLVRNHGQFSTLTLDTAGTRSKVGRLHTPDVAMLVEALNGAGGLQVVNVEEG